MPLEVNQDGIGVRAHLGQNQPRAQAQSSQQQGGAHQQGSIPRHSVTDRVALGVHAGIEHGSLLGSVRSHGSRISHQGRAQQGFFGLLPCGARRSHCLIFAREDVQLPLIRRAIRSPLDGAELERCAPAEQD